jgi:hypothetical protein
MYQNKFLYPGASERAHGGTGFEEVIFKKYRILTLILNIYSLSPDFSGVK